MIGFNFLKKIKRESFLVSILVFSFVFLYHFNSFACGNPGATCFLPGTLVTTSDGKKKPIEEIKIGDEVLGYDTETGDFTKNKVGSLMSVLSSDWYEIIFVGGDNLKVTKSHPLYIKKGSGKIGWGAVAPEWAVLIGKSVETKKIEEGDFIFNQDGNWQRIDKILKHNEFVRTYNLLNVGDSKTFFVEGLLAHNKTCFVAGTRVSMANGTFKNIEKVKIGDYVLGKNNKINKVIGLERPIVGLRKTYVINDKIEATGDHPFLTTEGWKVNDLEYKLRILVNSNFIDTNDNPINKDSIGQLIVGDVLFTKTGQEKIEKIEVKANRQFEEVVYDLNLNGDNTYYANEYLVHNCGWDTGGGGSCQSACTSASSACSASACGTTGTQITSTNCSNCGWNSWSGQCECNSSYTETVSSCSAPACPCVANCSCASSTCSGSTCSDGCWGNLLGN